MRLLKGSFQLLGIAFFVGVGAVLGRSVNISWKSQLSIEPVDLITIVLSAISVLLALLTIFLAVFALIGWRSINDGVREHSVNFLSGELEEGKPLFILIRDAAVRAMYDGVRSADVDAEFVDDDDSLVVDEGQ